MHIYWEERYLKVYYSVAEAVSSTTQSKHFFLLCWQKFMMQTRIMFRVGCKSIDLVEFVVCLYGCLMMCMLHSIMCMLESIVRMHHSAVCMLHRVVCMLHSIMCMLRSIMCMFHNIMCMHHVYASCAWDGPKTHTFPLFIFSSDAWLMHGCVRNLQWNESLGMKRRAKIRQEKVKLHKV